MKPVQIFSEFDFVCLCDKKIKNKDLHTIFVLQNLTVEQEAYLDDNMEGDPGKMRYGSTILDALHMGLKKVKNFKEGEKSVIFKRNEDGELLPGDVYPWKLEHLQRIPVAQRREICAKIRSLGITEGESKNSSS